MNRKILIFLIFSLWFTVTFVSAQQAHESFGKNRFQHQDFKWQYISGENFDVYYYDNRKLIAIETLTYLEGEFDRITDLIGFPPYFKTKVFLYNSLSDLRQSNVGLHQNALTAGGETQFIKTFIEVAHIGTAQEFKEELLFKTSELLINEMMYGGNLKDVFQNALLMNLPDWFVQGAVYYVAKGWNTEMDDFVRNLVSTKKIKKFSKLTPQEAALAGQSFWNFVAEKYGKSSVHNILNYTRVTRNEEKSLLITLGINYKKLLVEWELFYKQMAEQVNTHYTSAEKGNQLTKQPNRTVYYTALKISPDEQNIAYAENDRGRFSVIVKSQNNKKEKTILRGGTKVIDQRVDYNIPLISWVDTTTLCVIGIKKGKYWLWLYDLNTQTKLPRKLDNFKNIQNISFSSNGRLAIMSADTDGKNDLYLLSPRRDRIRKLTDDIYDDIDPSFVPGTNSIVFSSNRTSDSLKLKKKDTLAELTNQYSLYVFDLDTTKNKLIRITNTLSKDYAVQAINNTTFYYLSDQRGIINLFRYDRTNGIYSQVTNFNSSIIRYDLNTNTKTLAIVTNKNLKQNIYIEKNFDPLRQSFTPATRRKEVQQIRTIREKKTVTENKNMSVKDLINARMKEASNDTIKTQAMMPIDSVDNAKPDTLHTQIDTTKTTPDSTIEKTINTDDYSFEDEPIKETKAPENFLTRYLKSRNNNRVMGPFPYEAKFSTNNLVTSPVIDPLRGFGLRIETQMNDLLEDYRIYGGVMASFDFKSGDVYGAFEYLPNYVDLNVRFDRKAIHWETPNDPDNSQVPDNYNYSLNKLEIGASLPLNSRTRLTLKPFATLTRSVNLGPSELISTPPVQEPLNHFYAGAKSELIYDDAIVTGTNLIEGSRGKITFIHHQHTSNKKMSFSQVSIDLRHYQKLYKEMVFCVRGYGGQFFGHAPKQYLLGGMDNWAFNKSIKEGTSATGQPNPLGVQGETQDLLFVEYATSLRGFDYATLFGNSVLLANAELRLPLVRVLANGPVSSNFFRNLQLTAFYDIGTSWSGSPPFSSGNSVSYEIINQSPFIIEIKNYLNPWLYSYGFGMRSVILGYYMKFDFAWPVENFERKDPRLTVTLGYDF